MLRKIIFGFIGILIGNFVVIGVIRLIMLISKSKIETRRFWEAMSWFKYNLILHIIQVAIFILITLAITKVFKFELIKPKTNFLILGFLYSSIEPLLISYIVSPLFALMHKNRMIDSFMENTSKITHLPFITMNEMVTIPFITFIAIILTYNYLFRLTH